MLLDRYLQLLLSGFNTVDGRHVHLFIPDTVDDGYMTRDNYQFLNLNKGTFTTCI
jgi:hypothetical protein